MLEVKHMSEIEKAIDVISSHTQHFVPRDDLEALYIVVAAAEKLAEYETAEEEGRLVVLPCKVGDTVYAILHRRTLCTAQGREFEEYSCSGCEEEKCDSYLECFVWENKFATLEWIVGNLRKFGKTVFRTREEAEKALEKMKRAME